MLKAIPGLKQIVDPSRLSGSIVSISKLEFGT